MITIPAKTVYVHPDVRRQKNCLERLERVLPHVECHDIRVYDDAARDAVSRIGQRRHGKDDFGNDAVIVFTTFEPGRLDWYFNWRDEAAAHGGVCQPGLQLNIVNGCVFRCAYCGFGRTIHFSLDLERMMSELEGAFSRHPRQRLYKFSNMTDLPAFEPELDMVAPMIRRFAAETDRYLMLFTKSDNVGFLRGLDHGGRTIISWSITCDSASRLMDKRTAPAADRIEAMREMQAAGYLIRARLSPIIPVRDWRREYRELLERLFSRAKPDLVTMELLGWMGADDLDAIIDSQLLDPAALAAARAAAPELKGVRWGPFTQEVHDDIYRYCLAIARKLSPDTPVSVCHGTEATWTALGGTMRMTPDAYICNCGPDSAPGGVVYDRWHTGGTARVP